jgi:hypothetical protein
VSYDGEMLRVIRKDRWNVERFVERFGSKRSRQVYDLLIRNPANLHVCFHWNEHIDYAIADEVIRDGHVEEGVGEREQAASLSPWVNTLVTRFVRRSRVSDERLLQLLRCVQCERTELRAMHDGRVACDGCHRVYGRVDGWLDFRP